MSKQSTYRITGGQPVSGRIKSLGAKNFATKAMVAALLAEGTTRLANALTDQQIGLEETDDGLWSLYFHSVLLATLDERDYIIQS